MKWFYKHALYFAWAISLGGLFASIYYGEMSNLEPCRLCWYQRLGLFPLALFLGIATYKNDRNLALYSLPLVAFGAFFALYQSTSQLIPALQNSALCGDAAYCSQAGALPFFSAAGFVGIATFILMAKKGSETKKKPIDSKSGLQ